METTQNGAGRFYLPDDILSVVPTDPYDQLDLARKITSMAIASRVSQLEAETERLRQRAAQKDRVVAELQGRVEKLERMFGEADAHLRESLEENVNLSKERDRLVLTTKMLSRELAKLETFKRHLIQSLSEDNSSDEKMMSNLITSGNGGLKFSITPSTSPRLTPTGTPKITSTGGSPRGFSAAASPKRASGSTSPVRPYIGQSSLGPRYLTNQQSSAASSPTSGHPLPGQTPRIDGKEFFRQARNRLSYEQFGAFLANIKEFNAHRQSREETLSKAGEIFGTDNEDLYSSFQGLLHRSSP